MSLSEACYLAGVVHASNLAELLAIGRFLPTDQLAGADQWGCSVMLPDGRKATLWSMADWCQLVGQPTAKPAERQARPDAKHRNQLSLF